jgi:Icc-related predicted phosphoesterase
LRVLLASDLHYALRQLDWLAQRATDFDLVVLAGDHLDAGSAVPYDAQITAISTFLERLGERVPLIACSGNHDLDARAGHGERAATWLLSVGERGVHVDSGSMETPEWLVTVCPWWDGPVVRSELDALLAAHASRRNGRRWLWVHHAPPQDSPVSWTGRRSYGDEALVEWIEHHRPDLVLTGHVHEAPFALGGAWNVRIGPTWVLNAGRQRGPIPTCVELDLAAGTATWRSLAGDESIDFDFAAAS